MDIEQKIGIIGGGFVGQATKIISPNSIIYDIDENKCDPKETTLEDIKNCDIIFVCVPTPMKSTGECNTIYVENVISQLKGYEKKIILRSTVPVGTSKRLGVHFMPEFLTEKNWEYDVKNCNNWIVGINDTIHDDYIKRQLSFLLHKSSKLSLIKNNHIFISTDEAEFIKLARNSFLATKVSFFNEIYDFCDNINPNCYERIRHLICQDDRIGHSHSYIAPDGHRGFGKSCLPKDLSSLICQFKSKEIKCPILEAVQYRNDNIDRKEQDWKIEKKAFSQ